MESHLLLELDAIVTTPRCREALEFQSSNFSGEVQMAHTNKPAKGAAVAVKQQAGHSRHGKKRMLRVNCGLLTDARGRPAAVSVHKGNAADGSAFLPMAQCLRKRFYIN